MEFTVLSTLPTGPGSRICYTETINTLQLLNATAQCRNENVGPMFLLAVLMSYHAQAMLLQRQRHNAASLYLS